MSLDEKIKAGGLLWADDVEQFIKELKEELWINYQKKGLNKIINKLAGKGLI